MAGLATLGALPAQLHPVPTPGLWFRMDSVGPHLTLEGQWSDAL